MTITLFSMLPRAAIDAVDKAEDIRDIRGLLPVHGQTSWLWVALLCVLCVAVLSAIAFVWKKRRNRPPNPYSVAKQRLENAQAAMNELSAASFAAALFDAVRDYVCARFRVDAAHLTADELLSALYRREQPEALLAPQAPQLQHLMTTCEEAKFSGAPLSREAMTSLCVTALGIVERIEASANRGAA